MKPYNTTKQPAQYIKKWIFRLFIVMLIATIVILGIDQYVAYTGKSTLVTVEAAQPAQAILVLGAYVNPSGEVSRILKDRLDYALACYEAGKAPKIIVSGDHGSKTYDEVRAMSQYLEEAGVPPEDIFLDHAGFSTYDSVYRMKSIFLVDNAIIVTQEYHAVRAAYIAKQMDIEVQTIASDTYVYEEMAYYRFREVGARLKAFIMAGIVKPEPKYLGDVIPISESGLKTRD